MKTIWTKSEIAWCASHSWFISATQDRIVCIDEYSDGTSNIVAFLPEDGMQAIRDWAGY